MFWRPFLIAHTVYINTFTCTLMKSGVIGLFLITYTELYVAALGIHMSGDCLFFPFKLEAVRNSCGHSAEHGHPTPSSFPHPPLLFLFVRCSGLCFTNPPFPDMLLNPVYFFISSIVTDSSQCLLWHIPLWWLPQIGGEEMTPRASV